MLRQRAPDYGAQGPQLLLPTTPSVLPPNSLFSQHAHFTTLLLALFTCFPSARTHSTLFFESTPVWRDRQRKHLAGRWLPGECLTQGWHWHTGHTTTHWHDAGRNGTLAHAASNQHMRTLDNPACGTPVLEHTLALSTFLQRKRIENVNFLLLLF